MFRPLLTLLAFAVATPALAQNFTAENRLTVAPMADGAFEVIEAHGSGARALWCAAGDYARDNLNAADTARLYVVAPRGDSQTTPGRKAVRFALTPDGTAPRPAVILGVSTYNAGSNLSVAHATALCQGLMGRNGM